MNRKVVWRGEYIHMDDLDRFFSLPYCLRWFTGIVTEIITIADCFKI